MGRMLLDPELAVLDSHILISGCANLFKRSVDSAVVSIVFICIFAVKAVAVPQPIVYYTFPTRVLLLVDHNTGSSRESKTQSTALPDTQDSDALYTFLSLKWHLWFSGSVM